MSQTASNPSRTPTKDTPPLSPARPGLFAPLRLSQRLRNEKVLLLLLTLLALALRLWQLERVPPGWRDDELIEALVISQKVLNGDLAFFYPDASGHEALYHVLHALLLAITGPTAFGIRGLSVLAGTLAVPLTYLVGKRLFHPTVGWVAALGLAFSFWGLMYSRFGLRHVLLPTLVLAAFLFFWQSMNADNRGAGERRSGGAGNRQSSIAYPLFSAFFVALGFYTYFAGRGVPLILLAFMGYVWLMRRELFRRQWRQWALFLGVIFLLALPLALTLRQQPEAEGRVAELALPLIEARQGNFAPLIEYTRITLGMFHSTGDEEWLYNIPNRPLFSPIGALFLWAGVLWTAWQAGGYLLWHLGLRIASRSPLAAPRCADSQLPAAFLFIWWLAGISPAFISVPPASLGHTLLAQPATYLMAALPVWRLGSGDLRWKSRDRILETGDWKLAIGNWRLKAISNLQSLISIFLALLLVGSIAWRDLPDYFVNWPQRGMVRFLYHTDIRDVAIYVNENPELQDFGISWLLAGPWARLALELDLEQPTAVSPRWYHPERAIILEPALSFAGYPNVTAVYADMLVPTGAQAGGYALSLIQGAPDVTGGEVCFANRLCWQTAVYDATTHALDLTWRVGRELTLPPFVLISNPPPPGVYNGPRLAVFAQLWDGNGRFLTGDDGLWVDPYTLHPGDCFMQRHWLLPPQGSQPATIVIGLYDPFTGARILTEDGREFVEIAISD